MNWVISGQNNGSEVFDDSLQSAIKSFQIRYGMKADGIAGTAFLRISEYTDTGLYPENYY